MARRAAAIGREAWTVNEFRSQIAGPIRDEGSPWAGGQPRLEGDSRSLPVLLNRDAAGEHPSGQATLLSLDPISFS
jgi:hypothetical protein